MRIICHILRIFGYVTLLAFGAHAMSARFTSCMPEGSGVDDLLVAAATFVFMIGYGDIIHIKAPRKSRTTFWAANLIFYTVLPSWVMWDNFDGIDSLVRSKILTIHEAFVPNYMPYAALHAVGGISVLMWTIWMPLAAILSLVALVITLRDGKLPASVRTQ